MPFTSICHGRGTVATRWKLLIPSTAEERDRSDHEFPRCSFQGRVSGGELGEYLPMMGRPLVVFIDIGDGSRSPRSRGLPVRACSPILRLEFTLRSLGPWRPDESLSLFDTPRKDSLVYSTGHGT